MSNGKRIDWANDAKVWSLLETPESAKAQALADAKAEGWREGMLAAKKACQEASAGYSNPTAKRAAMNCAEHIDALLLASTEAKEPANG